MLVRRCAKPDKNEFSKIAMATGAGFAIMGFIGFFVKLMCVIVLPFTLQCYEIPDVVPSAGKSFASRQNFQTFYRYVCKWRRSAHQALRPQASKCCVRLRR